MEFILVGAGGFLGALARYFIYLLSKTYLSGSFPYATLVINVSGCFVAGLLLTWAQNRFSFSGHLTLFLMVGFLSSFTTFSTFGVETLELLQNTQIFSALISILSNVVLGIGAVYLGRWLILYAR